MKPFLYVLVLLSCFGYGCHKTGEEPVACIKVRIVGQICAEAVFQLMDSSYFHLGENGWKQGDQTFDHVFHSFLTCTDIDYLSKLAAPSVIGRELYVGFLEKNEDRNCIVCEATFSHPPATRQMVKFRFAECN